MTEQNNWQDAKIIKPDVHDRWRQSELILAVDMNLFPNDPFVAWYDLKEDKFYRSRPYSAQGRLESVTHWCKIPSLPIIIRLENAKVEG